MTTPSRKSTPAASKPQEIPVMVPKGERMGPNVAAKLVSPLNRHGVLALQFQGYLVSGIPEEDKPTLADFAKELDRRIEKSGSGDLTVASSLLTAQALTLDGVFTEIARRAADNMAAGYLPAFETYMRLALKAQAQSRTTLEALAKLHQPHVQTVRHVHVNDGGQAIVADEFHHHTGGKGNGRAAGGQPHAQGSCGSALPGPDAVGTSVPGTGRQRKTAMQNARREGKRCPAEEQERLEARRTIRRDTAPDPEDP